MDVELTPSEFEIFRKSGNLPVRYNHIDTSSDLIMVRVSLNDEPSPFVISPKTGKKQRRNMRQEAELEFLNLLETLGFFAPRREHKFHPHRNWRFDFDWNHLGIPLAIELHGKVYQQGRHTRGSGFEGDREKINEAQLLGWSVLEFSTNMVRDGRCIPQLIAAATVFPGVLTHVEKYANMVESVEVSIYAQPKNS